MRGSWSWSNIRHQLVELHLDRLQERWQVVDEVDDLAHEGPEEERHALDQDDDDQGIDDEDGQAPAQAASRQPADDRVEDVDEQGAEDEGAERAAAHVEHDQEQEGRPDGDGGPR